MEEECEATFEEIALLWKENTEMKKMSKHAKKALCIALSAAMLFTSTGMTVFAEESVQAEETQQEFQVEETSTDEISVEEEITKEAPVEDEVTEEAPVKEETAKQEESEEEDFIEEAEESALIEKEFDENVVTEEQTDNEDASAEESLTEKLEVVSTEDDVDAEETEVSENELKLAFSETDIAHGTSNNITWVINQDGHLTIEGTGDWERDNNSYYPAWHTYAESVKTAEVNVKGIKNAAWLFYGCKNLKSVDLSRFDTSSVTNMSYMFKGCSSLTSLDLSRFDTSSVTDMSDMFSGCSSLTSLDLSPLDTSSVTDMFAMFDECSSLTSLDLSPLDTSSVVHMDGMFYGCSNLTSLDLNPLDTGSVEYMNEMFSECSKLKTIYTPRNVKVSASLPDSWYDMSGAEYTELPKELSYSILLTRDEKPTTSTERITASKEKTSYRVGDTINTDDLTVRYYGSDGTVKILNSMDFTTSSVDTSIAGAKTLTVTYKGLTAEIKLNVSPKEEGGDTEESSGVEGSNSTEESNTSDKRPSITADGVLFPGKKKDGYSMVYTGERICPTMTVTYTYQDSNGKPKTQNLKLNVDYTVTYKNNINAGENATVTVKGIGEYQGTVTKKFNITQKSISKVTLSAVGDIKYGETPKVTVMDGTKELVQDTDYTLSWTEGNASTTTVSTLTVAAVKSSSCNYTGEVSKKPKFNILGSDAANAVSIADAKVAWKAPEKTYTYNGKAQKPAVVVTDKDGNKVASGYYKVIYSNNVNAGTNTAEAYVVGVTKKGAGCYGVSAPLKFTIGQKSFSKVSASIKGTLPKFGTISDIQNAINEAVVVKDGKTVLSYGEDYTIDYGEIKSFDNIKTGTPYEIKISPAGTGGNYKSEAKTLKIKFGQLNLASKTATTSLTITNVAEKKVTLTYNGKTLEQDKDYTVASIKQDQKTGLYTVKITAVKGSAYKGSLTFKGAQSLSLTLNKETITGMMGETVQLTATVTLPNMQNNTIEWKSSDESVATVTDKGLVSLVSSGMAVITASVNVEQLELTAQCRVTVKGELKNYVSVTDFGAVPDDGKDDREAFARAFDALGKGDYEGYDTVYVPEGTYHIEPEYGIVMPSNTKLYMHENAVLQAIQCSNHENQVIGVYSSDVEISGGTIIGELRATGKDDESGMGIRIQLAQNVYIHDVNIKECRGDGIYIGGNGKGSTNITITNCTIADCSRNCLGIVSAHEVYVEDCTITGAGSLFGGKAPRACILIEKNSGDDICTDIVIKNSTVDNKAVCSKQSEAYAFASAWINYPKDPVIQGDRLTVENCNFKGKVANYSVTNAKFINCTFDGEKILKQNTVVEN